MDLEKEYKSFLEQHQLPVDEWIKEQDSSLKLEVFILTQCHQLLHTLHHYKMLLAEMDQSCEQVNGKMLRAWQEARPRTIDPLQVLNLLSRS